MLFDIDSFLMNNKPIHEAEEDPPTDYTQDTDDAGGGDAPADTGGATGEEDTTPEDNPTDYTVPDSGDENQENQDPNADPNAQPAEGNNPEGGEGEDTGDPSADDTGEGEDTDTGDTSPDTDTQSDDEVGELEKEIFKDLSSEQLDIKHHELKNRFYTMYDDVEGLIDRINDIPKSEDTFRVLEFVSNKLNELSVLLSDYITNTYITKSYIENEINFNKFMAILNGINDVLVRTNILIAKE